MTRHHALRLASIFAVAIGLGSIAGCRTLHLDERAHAENFSVDWWQGLVQAPLLEYSPREYAQPVVDPRSGKAIALTRDGMIRCLDSNGKVLWERRAEGSFNAGALIDSGRVYVPGGNGVVYSLNLGDGKIIWKYESNEELSTSPVASNGILLVATTGDGLYALDQMTGKWLWQYRRSASATFTIRGTSSPVVKNGAVFQGFSDGSMVALTLADGSVKWERALAVVTDPFADVDSTPMLDGEGNLYVASYKTGIFSLNVETGETRWHTSVTGIVHLLLKGNLLFAVGDEKVASYTRNDGKLVWSLHIKNAASLKPELAKGILISPTGQNLLFIDAASGRSLTSWNPGKGISAPPFWSGSRLYVLSNQGYLYAMRIEAGR